MKHPTEDHSLFGIKIIDELVEDYMQLGIGSVEICNFVELTNVTNCFDSVTDVSDSINMPNMCEGDTKCSIYARIGVVVTKRLVIEKVATVMQVEFDSSNQMKAKSDSNNQLEASSDFGNRSCKQIEAEFDSGQPIPHSDRVGQPSPKLASKLSPPHSPPVELKPLPEHLKYAYLEDN
ncbi:hypothetical protein CR513_44109, partial [Mucuna pruriens]